MQSPLALEEVTITVYSHTTLFGESHTTLKNAWHKTGALFVFLRQTVYWSRA